MVELPHYGQLIYLAAFGVGLVIAYAAWTALRMPRLPPVMPSPSPQSGRPELPGGSGSSSSNSLKVPAQPLVSSQPSSLHQVDEQLKSTPEKPPAPVEFSIYAPSKVPADQPFDIRIDISVYDAELSEEIKDAGWPTFESLVLDLHEGDMIRLELHEGEIELDASEQSVTWRGRDMTVVFVGRIPTSARKKQEFTTTLVVFLYELPLGFINFTITCDATVEYDGRKKQYWEKEKIRKFATRAKLEGKGFGALRYKRIFIAHVSEDSEEVSYIVDFLRYAGIVVVFAQHDFSPAFQIGKCSRPLI